MRPDAEAEEMRLIQQVETATKLADQLREEYQKARITEAVEVGQVEVVDLATLEGDAAGVVLEGTATWDPPTLPLDADGQGVAHRLISAIRSGPDHRPVVEVLPTRLVVRESSAAPRGEIVSDPAGGGGVAAA